MAHQRRGGERHVRDIPQPPQPTEGKSLHGLGDRALPRGRRRRRRRWRRLRGLQHRRLEEGEAAAAATAAASSSAAAATAAAPTSVGRGDVDGLQAEAAAERPPPRVQPARGARRDGDLLPRADLQGAAAPHLRTDAGVPLQHRVRLLAQPPGEGAGQPEGAAGVVELVVVHLLRGHEGHLLG